MHNFAVGGHAGKSDVNVAFKLDSHLEESHTKRFDCIIILKCCCDDLFQKHDELSGLKTHFHFAKQQASFIPVPALNYNSICTEWKILHLSYVPVDVPLLHVVVAPGLHHITHTQVNPDQAVGSNSQDLVFPTALKPVGQVEASSVKLLCHDLNYLCSF